MDIRIKIENRTVEIGLWDGNAALDRSMISQEHRLSEELLPEINALLIRNKLHPKNIERMLLQSDLGENFTTYRIASATVEAFNWNKNIIGAVDN